MHTSATSEAFHQHRGILEDWPRKWLLQHIHGSYGEVRLIVQSRKLLNGFCLTSMNCPKISYSSSFHKHAMPVPMQFGGFFWDLCHLCPSEEADGTIGKLLCLGREWLFQLIPHVLSKVNRVQCFGQHQECQCLSNMFPIFPKNKKKVYYCRFINTWCNSCQVAVFDGFAILYPLSFLTRCRTQVWSVDRAWVEPCGESEGHQLSWMFGISFLWYEESMTQNHWQFI